MSDIPQSKAGLINFLRKYLLQGAPTIALEKSGYLYLNGMSGDQYIRGTGNWLTIDADARLYLYADQTVYIQEGDLNVVAGDLTVAGTDNSIGQEAWTAVTFATNWEDLSTSYEDCSYFKDSMGFVHIRGVAQCTTGTTPLVTIFTLPAGYRPSRGAVYACRSQDTAHGITTCEVIIRADGTVKVSSDFTPASGAWVSLSGILFDTRAAT